MGLDLHLQIGIDVQDASGLKQAIVLITLRVMDVITRISMRTLSIGHDRDQELKRGAISTVTGICKRFTPVWSRICR